MKKVYEFTVFSKPKPKAQSKHFFNKKTGKMWGYTPKGTAKWESIIRDQSLPHKPATLIDGPIALSATFYLLRPKSKAKKYLYPAWQPDFDNLTKAVVDAMEGIFFTNDSRIVDATISKRYGDPPRVTIKLEEL